MSLDSAYHIVGEGEPMIFIHGIGSRKHTWNGVIEGLKKSYQCISYDLRGHGESIKNESDFTLSDLVQDLENLRSNLNIDKTHIIGHSLGGMIGPSYARKYMERVLSISLISTAAFRNNYERQLILNIIKQIQTKGLNYVLPSLIDRWFTDEFINKNPKIIDQRIKQVQNTPLKIFLNVFRLYALTEMDSWLNEIKVPCLVITGENDIGCNPKVNQMICDALPNSKLVILDHLKHTITLEAPELLSNNINKFLNNIKK